MRKLIVLGLVVVGMLAALPAQAHDWNGSGDCEGWTLNLDGTWNAVEIFVDGVSVGLNLTPTIPDASDATSRTFEVRWDKAPAGPSRSDVSVSHTLERDGNCTPPTTIPEEPTTTTPETPTTTTPEVTTTTQPETTTTAPEDTTTALQATTFLALASCLPDGSFEISVEFGDGVVEARVSLLDPMFPIEGDDPAAEILYPDDSTTRGKLPTYSEWSVLGIAAPGYQIEGDNPVVLGIDPCPQPSTVEATTPTTGPTDASTLPYTGVDPLVLGLAGSLAFLAGLGLVLRGRHD